MKTIAFHNLGCKVNSYEMDVMVQKCVEKGFKIVEFEQKADIYVVNTCSVTNIADRKSRQMLHKARKTNPDSIVVAVGCLVQANPEEVAGDEAIDLIVGNNKKKEIAEILESFIKEKDKKNAALSKDLDGETLTDIRHCEYEEMKVFGSAERCRVFVKIQDGCDRYCSYCIIPYTRGNIRSRKKEDIIDEINGIALNGYREVVLTGIHISSYGKDFALNNGISDEKERSCADHLYELIEEVSRIEGIERIRIGSFEPMILSEDFVKKLSGIKKLCPHFHISLQSGCDAVLKRMNRHYNTDEFYEKTVLLRKFFPGCAITTDVIAGFPGESEEEFEETYRFLEKVSFFETHIFPYSRRKGTVADRMDGQLTQAVKRQRVSRLMELDEKESAEFRKSKLGETTDIIVEETKETDGKIYYVGHTPEYIFAAVEKEKLNDDFIGQKVRVRLKSLINNETVLAECL
ncbi:MAG: tRNA (N(6)-L-threonylcarbamoyladenosine(37)-C(2))-methylthiotransferase MtaB [Lachnospiraceae bacterium]|nr:tRNA (N(6)-L-threonylcarbamoyladenosine(37)-C(2))-methylthiotransferase MtaB [Lachnospiraceae bacterium]